MLHLLQIDRFEIPPESAGHPHRHPWHELLLIETGRYAVEIDGQQLEGGPGQVFIYRSGRIHLPLPTRIRPQIVLLQWQDDPVADRPVKITDVGGRMLAALVWLWELAQEKAPSSILVGVLAGVLHLIDAKTLSDDSLIRRACTYLRQNLAYNLPVDELARSLRISPATLFRMFAAEMGCSPQRWRRRQRAEHALRMIRAGQRDLGTVAKTVGYTSASHLSRVMRAELGQPPSAWMR